MRAGLAQGLAVLLLWVVLVVLVEAPPPLPQPASHQHAVNLVTDFVSTYMPVRPVRKGPCHGLHDLAKVLVGAFLRSPLVGKP